MCCIPHWYSRYLYSYMYVSLPEVRTHEHIAYTFIFLSLGLVAEPARPAEARAGCLFGPAGLGGRILKYSYLWKPLKHFQHGVSMESNISWSTHNQLPFVYSLNISPFRAHLLYCWTHNYKVASVFKFCRPDFPSHFLAYSRGISDQEREKEKTLKDKIAHERMNMIIKFYIIK